MIPLRNLKRFFYKAIKQPGYAFRVLFKRICAGFYYKFGRSRSPMPEAVTLFLTHRCNLRCLMCGQWGEGGVTKTQDQAIIQQELTPEQIRSVIDDLARYKSNITLFGGEPLLFPGCVELIGYIRRKGLHCLMISNGSLLEKYAEGIVDAGLNELNISLDGGEELHDQIRGMPGLFQRIISGVERVNYFKAAKNASSPLVNLQCTITKYNYRHLEQLLGVAGRIKADSLTFHNLIFLDAGVLARQKPRDVELSCSSKNWEGFVFDPSIDPEELYKKIMQVKKGKYSFSVDFYPNFGLNQLQRYYCDMGYQAKGACCLSPWVCAYIFPDGQIRPCLNSSYSFGDITKNPLAMLWNSEKAAVYRRTLLKQGIFPVCARCTELYRY